MDSYLSEQIARLETAREGQPDSTEVRRARVVLLRARQAQRDNLIRNAPLLRRHLLFDIRNALIALEKETLCPTH